MKKPILILLVIALPLLVYSQAQRKVLIEEFTQASCPPCGDQNPDFDALVLPQEEAGNVVLLKYQVWWPGYDPMYQQNPDDVDPRVSYYNVLAAPNVRVDGSINVGQAYQLNQSTINNRLNLETPLEMDLTHSLNLELTMMNISVVIKNVAAEEFNATNHFLRLAMTETAHFPEPPGTTPEVDYHSIMRKMIPNATGTALTNIAPGDSLIFTFDVEIPDYIYDYSTLSVVAFVQNDSGRGVVQSEISFPIELDGYPNAGLVINTTGPSNYCDYSLTPGAEVSNDGDVDITSFDISYILNGGSPVTENWTGTLSPGSVESITFAEASFNPGDVEVEYYIDNINGGVKDFTRLNELNNAEDFMTLNDTPIGTSIEDGFESAPVEGSSSNTLLERGDDVIEFMVVDEGWLEAVGATVPGAVGGYGESSKSMFAGYWWWNEPGDEAHMIFEKVDLSSTSAAYLKFDYAYAQYPFTSFTTDDGLRIDVSTNCGETWTTIWDNAGSDLATVSPSTTFFVPSSSQWESDSISLADFDGAEELNVRFTAISDWGNNLYIDNINIGGELVNSTDEPNLLAGKVEVYPNPASDDVTIDLNLVEHTALDLAIYDITGRLIERLANGAHYNAGHHQIKWTPANQGVYLVRIATEFGELTKRITVLK